MPIQIRLEQQGTVQRAGASPTSMPATLRRGRRGETTSRPQLEHRINRAMILAAGEGRRLRPLTLDRPKPMLPVAGRPLLEHSIRWLRHFGISHFAINLHHQPDVVTSYFGDGSRLGIDITYSVEPTLLGTAGGVKRLAPLLDEPFVLLYGDVLTDLDLDVLVHYHLSASRGAHLTICLYRVPNPLECGIVEMDCSGRIVRFVEKPGPGQVFSDLANSGVLIVDPRILQFIPPETPFDFGRDLLPALLEEGIPVFGWPLPETSFLIDIGSPDKYDRVQSEWPTAAARAYIPRS